MTQKEWVLAYMMNHGSITSMEAFDKVGITRLAAIIFDLRKQGYKITTDDIRTDTSRFGSTTYAKYILEKDLVEA